MSDLGLSELDPKSLGQRLMEARKARRLTQEEVAERIGIARTTVVAIEQGVRRVRPNELIQMSDIYGRSLSELTRQGPSLASFAVQFRSALRPVEHAEEHAGAEDLESLAGLLSGRLF